MAASEQRRRSGRGGKRLTGTPPPLPLLALMPLQPDQETVTQHHQHSMAMKALPQPSLVLVSAQQPLGLFVRLFHPVAAMDVFHHHGQRGRWRKVAPEVPPLSGLPPRRPFPDQPAGVAGPIPIHAPAAEGVPLPAGQGNQHLVSPLDWGRGVARQHDAEIGPYPDDIPLTTGFQPVQEGGLSP